MRSLAFSLLLVSSVATASDDHLVGWSGDNTFYAVYGTTCADPVVLLCAVRGAKPSWPAKYGVAENGACVASYDQQDLLELNEDALAKLAPVHGGAAPAGVKVTLSSKGEKATVVVAKGSAKLTFTVDDVPGAKLDKVIWRADGKQLAVSIKTKNHGICTDASDHAVAVFDVAGLGAPIAAGDRPAAKAKNIEGMKALGKQDYANAAVAFKAAIQADATFLLAHYNLASVASVAGDLATARAELDAINKDGSAEAKKMLAQAKSDPDLDFSSTDPGVRTLIGAGGYPTDATKRLIERNGIWSSEGPGCQEQTGATVMLKLSKGGRLAITPICDGAKLYTNDEKWTVKALILENAPLLGDGDLTILWTKCPGSDVDGSCFQVGDRTFHRGVPHGK
jgi:hypothetical protein